MTVPLVIEGWDKCHRIVSSRFPPVGIFDDVARPEDLEGVFYVEGLTNPRIREEMGSLTLIPREEWLAGPGTTPIMAAFTHPNPSGSRFSDGALGVYYGARCANTAIAETVYHVELAALESHDPPTSFTMRHYVGPMHPLQYHDIRGLQHKMASIYDPVSYSASQSFAAECRKISAGILYNSVRYPGGDCVAAFRPTALGPVTQTRHYSYVWDGKRVVDVLLVRSVGSIIEDIRR